MAVGWSSDVLPVAKRLSNVAVIVPKSGTSLWADLWVSPDSFHNTSIDQNHALISKKLIHICPGD